MTKLMLSSKQQHSYWKLGFFYLFNTQRGKWKSNPGHLGHKPLHHTYLDYRFGRTLFQVSLSCLQQLSHFRDRKMSSSDLFNTSLPLVIVRTLKVTSILPAKSSNQPMYLPISQASFENKIPNCFVCFNRNLLFIVTLGKTLLDTNVKMCRIRPLFLLFLAFQYGWQ